MKINLNKLFILVFILNLIVNIANAGFNDDDWRYFGQFHKKIRKVNKIIVRDSGFNCCTKTEVTNILFCVTNRQEIAEIYNNISFLKWQKSGNCMCCGYPRIDWYRGTNRIAITALQHGTSLRWKNFDGDAALTKKSRRWFREWLNKNIKKKKK